MDTTTNAYGPYCRTGCGIRATVFPVGGGSGLCLECADEQLLAPNRRLRASHVH